MESIKAIFAVPPEELEKAKKMEQEFKAELPAVPTKVVPESPAPVDAPDEIVYILADNGKLFSEKMKAIEQVNKAPYAGRTYYYKSKSDPFTVFDFKDNKAGPQVGAN